jgi:WD repeat-containing protein 45
MSILGLSFNQCMTHMSVGTDLGCIIYKLNPEFEKKIHHEKNGGVGIMKMLNKSNISVLVGGGDNPFRSRDSLFVWDENQRTTIMEIDLREPIRNVFLNKENIIVVLRKKIYMLNYEGNQISMKPTFGNDSGVCALSTDEDRATIVTLGLKKGSILVWRLVSDEFKQIDAHESNIVALAINNDGGLVASASETGTVIKVFNTNSKQQVYELRRGTTGAKVHHICFSSDSRMLACISGNGTVHIFELGDNPETTKNAQSVFSGFKDYLPQYFSSQWGFKQIPIETTSPAICGFDEKNVLHIATREGQYFRIEGKEYDKIVKKQLETISTAH